MKTFNTIITLTLLSLTQACSHTDPKELPTNIVQFVEASGKIEIEFKGKEWQKLTSKGSASLFSKNKVAVEQAMNVATLRAKASLVEFLDQDVKSSRATSTITKALNKDGGLAEEENSEIASSISEDISSDSRHILKGAYVVDRSVAPDQDYVSVTVVVERRMIEASKSISNSFNK
jgi:hypothetical protein